jgi:hypothetical protein
MLLLLVALLVAAGIGEVAVRCIRGDQIVLYPRFHSRAVYGDYTLRRLRPRTVFWHTSVDGHWRFATNGKGFRSDRDIPYARVPGRLRVLVLGDSHTEGFEVRQDFTYSAVIERWLNSHGVPADVLNTGVSGFGTAEELAFLENEGIRYHPDVVVLGFFANDFDDNAKSGLFVLKDDTLTAGSKVYAPATRILDVLDAIPPIRWLSENSYLYSYAFNTVWDWFKAASFRRARATSSTEYVTPVGPPTEGELSLTKALLSRMSRFCRAHGILFIVIDVPVYQDGGVGAFTTSIPRSLLESFRQATDVLLLSDDILAPYRGVAEIHAAHGAHHISEFTHLMFGVRAAEVIRQHAAGGQFSARNGGGAGGRHGLRPLQPRNTSDTEPLRTGR